MFKKKKKQGNLKRIIETWNLKLTMLKRKAKKKKKWWIRKKKGLILKEIFTDPLTGHYSSRKRVTCCWFDSGSV